MFMCVQAALQIRVSGLDALLGLVCVCMYTSAWQRPEHSLSLCQASQRQPFTLIRRVLENKP